ERPRLGQLADLPSLHMPLSLELELWESAYGRGEIGGLALMPTQQGGELGSEEFYTHWLETAPSDRILVSFEAQDYDTVQQAAGLLAEDHRVLLLPPREGQSP